MYRKIEDYQKDWQYETEQTIKLFQNLTDESLGKKITEDGRSLGFLAWHLIQTMGEMLGLVGLTIDAPDFEASVPNTKDEIISTFEKAANSVKDEVSKNWTDETLLQKDEMYGEVWTRGQTLFYMSLHQAHHRGQITVLMRQSGLKVVGIYGPAKEEWAEQGMPAMA
jgi:uncharacterized damage-inducible protein DinB